MVDGKLVVVDFFAGREGEDKLHGWSRAFAQRGHKVITLDFNPAFNCDITDDVMKVTVEQIIEKCGGVKPDVILASPDCSCYSVASIGTYWNGPGDPKHPKARAAMEMLHHTVDLIKGLGARYFIIENPRGMMRKMPVMIALERRTTTYCNYEDGPEPHRKPRMKPTDFWGEFPKSLVFHPACKNGDPCHEAAPRGARTGTQGIKGSADRAVIPYRLSLQVCEAVEREMQDGK